MSNLTEISGEWESTRWRSDDGSFVIGFFADGTPVKGTVSKTDGEFVPGLSYRLLGKWDDSPKYGRQFSFRQAILVEPSGRHGVTCYLERYAAGIGPAIAAQLFHAFGSEAVKTLRTQPLQAAAACPKLRADVATAAAESLQEMAELEETKIALADLFSGRGFPLSLIDAVIERWGIKAPNRIKRNPFCLLIEGFPGCGFVRCDRLWLDLGLPPGKLKRQVMCLWHAIKSDTSGHTWLASECCFDAVRAHVSGAPLRMDRALKIAVKCEWVTVKTDSNGCIWLADSRRAYNENYLAERVAELVA